MGEKCIETQLAVLPHTVLEDTTSYDAPACNADPAMHLSNKALATIVRADVINVNSSDGSNSSLAATARLHPQENEDRRSLSGLQRNASSRRGSQISLVSLSPRPGSRGSRHSTRRSSRRKGSDERMTRGEMLMELVRRDSIKSRESRRSIRDLQSLSRRRKDTATSVTRSDSSASRFSENGAAFAKNGRRNYMTAQEAVLLGDKVCGCMLKSRLAYFLKPLILLFVGITLIAGGVALTILHFMYEDVVSGPKPNINVPYFTWGPITLSTGLIVFMVALVWFPIKEQKWKDGTASPMIVALKKWHEENDKIEEMEMRSISMLESPGGNEKMVETRLDMDQIAQNTDHAEPFNDKHQALRDGDNV